MRIKGQGREISIIRNVPSRRDESYLLLHEEEWHDRDISPIRKISSSKEQNFSHFLKKNDLVLHS